MQLKCRLLYNEFMATAPKKVHKKPAEEDELIDLPEEEFEDGDDEDNPSSDKVTEAYENITKRLEKLRKEREEREEEDAEAVEEDTEEETDEVYKEPEEDLPPKHYRLGGKNDEDDDEKLQVRVHKEEPAYEEDEDEDPLDREDISEDEANEEEELKEEFEEEEKEQNIPPKRTFESIPPREAQALRDHETFPADEPEQDEAPEEISRMPQERMRQQMPTGRPLRRDFDQGTPEQEHTLEDLAEEEVEDDEQGHHIPPLSSAYPSKAHGTYQRSMPHPAYQQDYTQPPQRPFNGNGNYYADTRHRSSKWQLLFLVLVGIGVISGTVFVLKSQFSEKTPEATPAPTMAAVVQTPTPVPTPAVDRAGYKVRVLNGTTKTGLAKQIADKLKGLGYQQEKVGNATNSAFERTVVRAKDIKVIDALMADLKPDFDATAGGVLKDSDTADAEVILGTK